MTMASSCMIRPVCHRLPSSVKVWDDSNLPLSCVLQPLAGINDPSSSAKPSPLASIPKCLHCGAPHPTSTSHYPLPHSLLCHLCGKTSSTRIDDQSDRRQDEYLEQSGYRNGSKSRVSSSVSGQIVEYSLPMYDSIDEISAIACPPLWWIVVEGSPSRSYWNTISSALQTVVAKLPPYVHVGLCMASSTTLSLWNLTSVVPLVQHYSFQKDIPSIAMADVGTYQSHMQAALRAMGDSLVATEGGVPMVKVLEFILDQLAGARHPGQEAVTPEDNNKRCYAGGRVLLLLNGPPEELAGSNSSTTGRKVGMGGYGGACYESGLRFSGTAAIDSEVPDLAEDDPEMGSPSKAAKKSAPKKGKGTNISADDLTAKNLELHYAHVENKSTIMSQFAELGQQFAEAAVGIDVVVVQQDSTSTDNSKPIGVPLMKPLTEATGAPGPVLLDLDADRSIIENEIWSRSPSNSYGGLLRMRLSPGFKVDTSRVDATSRSPLELAPLHVRGGLMGCATSAAKSADTALWHVGACDVTQAMTVDLQVTNKMKRFAFVEGMGEVALKPCLQAVFAYTTVVPSSTSSEDNEDYTTVRRIRICTLHLPMVNEVESLYAALDPEALSVVLFQKMAMAAFMEPLEDSQDIGRNWLKYIMTCAYQSAEKAEARQKSNSAQGLESDTMFYPSERLLDREGQLTRTEVLLGQGHDILRLLPLLVWCTLQCDPIRPSSETYRPNLDARCAALMQMTSMSPLVLARCIAPRLEIWQSGADAKEAIVSAMDLSVESIAGHLMEHQQTDPNLILLLDSPFGILVCDSRHLRAAQGDGVEVGPALEEAIQQACESYRSPPPITYALDLNTPMTQVWKDFLVEDAISSTSMQDFAEWKKETAAAILESLEDDGDY